MKKLFGLTLIAFVLTSILVSCPQGSEKNGTTGGNGITTTGGTSGSTQGGSSGESGSDNTGGSSGSESGNGSEPSTPKTYIVQFEANGGSGTMQPQVFAENEKKELNPVEFAKEAHKFLGWATSSTGDVVYADKAKISPTNDMTLWAKWEAIPTYTVTFNANGGSGDMAAQVFIPGVGQALEKNKYTREGLNFKWWIDENGTKYNDQEIITLSQDMTLSAVWTCLGSLPGYVGTAGPDWEYVTFGEWPQSVLPEDSSVTISRYDTKEGVFTYYKGSDGAWYVDQIENAKNRSTSASDIHYYSDGSQAKTGSKTSRYFKVEPIKWRVLTVRPDGKALLFAENGLISMPYYDNQTNRFDKGKNVYPTNYYHSKVRAWLNGLSYYRRETSQYTCSDYKDKGFLQTAFTNDEQNKIAILNVDNSPASTGSIKNEYACEDTKDKVFLLSRVEATNPDYGFAEYNKKDAARYLKPTDLAIATGAYHYQNNNHWYSFWFSRSPSTGNYADRMMPTWMRFLSSEYIDVNSVMIAPALWVEYEE